MNTGNAYDDYPGIDIPAAPLSIDHDLRDASGNLRPPSPPVVDNAFWATLLKALNDKPEEERMSVLIDAVKADRIIRTPRKTADANTRNALQPILQKLFDELSAEHLSNLTDSACGRLLNIKYKFGLSEPDDYEFARHSVFDPYEEQAAIDDMQQFVQTLERTVIQNPRSILRFLQPGNNLQSLSDVEKQELAEAMVRDCAAVLGIHSPLKIKYNPALKGGRAKATWGSVESVIEFGPSSFSGGAIDLINLVAHEVEHLNQSKRRFTFSSKQTARFGINGVSSWPSLQTKKEKYRENIIAIRASQPTFYENVSGNPAERWSNLKGMAAAIWAAKSPIFNPEQQGILWKVDPHKSRGDLRLRVAELIEKETGVTLRDMVTRPYWVKPLKSDQKEKPFAPLDVDKALEGLHRWHDIQQDPMNCAVEAGRAWLASMPEIAKRASTPSDPMHGQCRDIVWRLTEVCDRPALLNLKDRSADAIIEMLQIVVQQFPDDLTRAAWIHDFSEQIKNTRPDLASVLHKNKLNEVVAAVERKFPLPSTKDLTPDFLVAHIELQTGVSMSDVAVHFGFSGKARTGLRKTLDSLWALEKLPPYPCGAQATIDALLDRMPRDFHAAAKDDKHPLNSQAQLLQGIIQTAVTKSANHRAPSLQTALKLLFESRFQFQFANRSEHFDESQRKKFGEIALDFPHDACYRLVDDVAARSMNLPTNVERFTPNADVARIEREVGVSMPELAAHFGFSGNVTTDTSKALEALWALEKLPPSTCGPKTAEDLLERMPSEFHAALKDDRHPLYTRAALLQGIVRTSIARSRDSQSHSLHAALKFILESRFEFQFASSFERFDDVQRSKLKEIAKDFPCAVCHQLVDEIAASAMNLSADSQEKISLKEQLALIRQSSVAAPVEATSSAPTSHASADVAITQKNRGRSQENPALTDGLKEALDKKYGASGWIPVSNRYIPAADVAVAMDCPNNDVASLRAACFLACPDAPKSKAPGPIKLVPVRAENLPSDIKVAVVLGKPIRAFNVEVNERATSRRRGI